MISTRAPRATQDVLREASRRLALTGSSSPTLDALLLMERVTGFSRTSLFAHPERPLEERELTHFAGLLNRRCRAEPIAYILGEREFYGRTFRTDGRALIPRPETELLVEAGLEFVAATPQPGVLVDVGTGCGAIAISVAAETGRHAAALDISPAALTLARENACALGQKERVHLLRGRLLQAFRSPLLLVLANLPYLPRSRALPPDVAWYEPAGALFGGAVGTELIRDLLVEASALLQPGGLLACEIDDGQAPELVRDAERLFARRELAVLRDGAGLERVLRIQRGS